MDTDDHALSLDEFDEACQLETAFCPTVSLEEYEHQTVEATDTALQDLIAYLDRNPEKYTQILRKKKVEEMENGGIFSFMKVKVMSLIHGEQFPACLVAPDHAQNQLNHLKQGMKRAFEYTQENTEIRRSSRIAARKPLSSASARLNASGESQSQRSAKKKKFTNLVQSSPGAVPVAKIPPQSPSLVPPPPPPPPPPPMPSSRTTTPCAESDSPVSNLSTSAVTADSSDHEFITPPSYPRPTRRHRRTVSNSSTSSQKSNSSQIGFHSELISSNPLKRLRSTKTPRSPGGTPVRAQAEKELLAHSEPLHKALISVMKRKFRNIRSPSPRSVGHSCNNSLNNTCNNSLNNTYNSSLNLSSAFIQSP